MLGRESCEEYVVCFLSKMLSVEQCGLLASPDERLLGRPPVGSRALVRGVLPIPGLPGAPRARRATHFPPSFYEILTEPPKSMEKRTDLRGSAR